MQQITGEELSRLAKKHINRETLKKALSEDAFREFMRIFIFMSMASAESKEPSIFGHYFIMRDSKGDPVELEVDIKITSKGGKNQ